MATAKKAAETAKEEVDTDVVDETETAKEDELEVEYVKVESPLGAVTTVPSTILDALLDSGYKKSKK